MKVEGNVGGLVSFSPAHLCSSTLINYQAHNPVCINKTIVTAFKDSFSQSLLHSRIESGPDQHHMGLPTSLSTAHEALVLDEDRG